MRNGYFFDAIRSDGARFLAGWNSKGVIIKEDKAYYNPRYTYFHLKDDEEQIELMAHNFNDRPGSIVLNLIHRIVFPHTTIRGEEKEIEFFCFVFESETYCGLLAVAVFDELLFIGEDFFQSANKKQFLVKKETCLRMDGTYQNNIFTFLRQKFDILARKREGVIHFFEIACVDEDVLHNKTILTKFDSKTVFSCPQCMKKMEVLLSSSLQNPERDAKCECGTKFLVKIENIEVQTKVSVLKNRKRASS